MKYSMSIMFLIFLLAYGAVVANDIINDDTQTCIECHDLITHGIVADWEKT